jgi:hypothetical protein
LAFAVGLETLIGFSGFFSDFKSIFFVLLVVLPGAGFIFKGWRLVQFIAVAVCIFILGAIWSETKGEYRDFLNEGSGQQEVNVPMKERLEKFAELVGRLNLQSLEDGCDKLLARISYVQYFALTIGNVPSGIPYENGALWWGSIKHVFMPRLFFPNKPAIDDSERTAYYTGVQVGTAEQGASISIGYFGESYIDFGPVGMFAPIFLLGLFYGFIYRFFISYSPKKIIGFALAVSILVFGAYTIETSNIKILGGNVTDFLAMMVFMKVCGKRFWNLIAQSNATFSQRRKRQKILTPVNP